VQKLAYNIRIFKNSVQDWNKHHQISLKQLKQASSNKHHQISLKQFLNVCKISCNNPNFCLNFCNFENSYVMCKFLHICKNCKFKNLQRSNKARIRTFSWAYMKNNFEVNGLIYPISKKSALYLLPFLHYKCMQKCVQKSLLTVTFDLDRWNFYMKPFFRLNYSY